MRTSLSADISIIFVLILFVICTRTSDSARLNLLAHRYLIFDLYYYGNVSIRVCIGKHSCTSIGFNLCINALVLICVLVFI